MATLTTLITDFIVNSKDEIYYKLLKAMTIHDIADKVLLAVAYASVEPKPIQAIGAVLGQELAIKHPFTAIEVATELLNVGCESDLFNIQMVPNAIKIKANFSLPDSLVKAIDMAQYPMPMLCEPREINGKQNMDTSHIQRISHLILGKNAQHKQRVCVDAINILNSIPLSLDEHTLEYEETPSKPLDTKQKREQFQKLKDDSRAVYDQMMEDGNLFWLTWKFDHRGRAYSQGYHINIQSTEYKKSLINFAIKEVME